jgi:DNA polymerase I-like protein with 3'-5' exonuclease and polymerase domains
MKTIILDLETTVQFLDSVKDNSPFHPKNKIVSAHWRLLENGSLGPAKNAVFFHNEKSTPDSVDELVHDLKSSDLLVAHNAKFDLLYLYETNLPVPEKVWCTMIGEYILARAQRVPLGLKATAERRDVTRKKSDLVDELFHSGTGFEAMPLDTVIEYADADVLSCAEIYMAQLEDLQEDQNRGLYPVYTLMNEMLLFLCEIERNGICIDLSILSTVEEQFVEEKRKIEHDLESIVSDVMGDTPINLNSGVDMTKVVYSREINDRDYHKRTFNIGVDHRGKPLHPARMTRKQFLNTIRKSTRVVRKTIAQHCQTCDGTGMIQKYKKNGEPYKNRNKCTSCGGCGFLLLSTGETAGLKLVPDGPQDASINGFKTDKGTIKRLIAQAESKDNPQAIEFLTKLSRLNAVNTYLDSFVKNIHFWTRPDGFLHAQFNQCTTRTGRLSSSNPNFQNQPKGGKFPVRKCVVSRFEGGQILEADFSGLEFRVAGELSKDSQIIEDILNGKDVHKQTASIINQCDVSEVSKDMRQGAKAYTFAPLYGGMGAGEPEHVQKYFKEYFNIYSGLADWHQELMNGVLRTGIVRTPSGREFFFPGAKRLRNGRITNATSVVNYPVQSFATADIVPLACVRCYRMFKEADLKSRLILTVHDSIVVDVFPGEEQTVYGIVANAMSGVAQEVKERFDYELVLPLDIEMEAGPNWMETSPISLEQVS